jgi:hypothetical protein
LIAEAAASGAVRPDIAARSRLLALTLEAMAPR